MSNSELKHILLVEDEPVYAMNIKRQLTKEGYRVSHVLSGEQALFLLKNEEKLPDIIVMDVILNEGTDSIEASQRILEYYDIPLMFHSSFTDREIVERTASVDHYGYIVKTPDISVLDISVRNVLRLAAEKKHRKEAKGLDRIRNLLVQKDSILNAIIESSPDIIVFALDREYRYISFNQNHKNTMRQIWGRDINEGDNMLTVIGLDTDRINAKKNFDRALAGEHFVLEEEYGDEKLSRLYWVDFYSPLISPGGKITGLSCFVLNNTKQRMAEEQVTALLREKELILKEVHHRIKNNMNNIIMLLNYQADISGNTEAIDVLHNAAARARSMMVLYQKLYQAESFLDISLRTYIESLMEEFFKILPEDLPIEFSHNIENIKVNINTASCIGIIINELATNSIKHAFNGRDKGHINIEISREDNIITLEYHDNGTGIKEDAFAAQTGGFGITLINQLAGQLESHVEVLNCQGTGIRISFKYNQTS